MRAFKKLIHSARVRIEPKQPAAPEPLRKRRQMTGFLATLTDEQREAVLSFNGPDLLGDPTKIKP
ncbi:MAG: hypothetical protein ACTHLT_12320 [Devosia sp.]